MTTNAYLRPTHLETALEHLAAGGCRVAAGCTDLFAATEAKVLPGPVLDITGLAALRGITQSAAGLSIGATTSWSAIRDADLPPACHALQEAARQVGGAQIQNQATLAGNLCNASPAADGVPPLLTLDAEVELQALGGARRLKLPEFLEGPRKTGLAPGELLTRIHIPAHALAGQSHFIKLGARAHLVISIAMVAARIVLTDGRISQVALAAGACGPTAVRLTALEAVLTGQVPDPDLVAPSDIAAALSPIDDVRGTADYRIAAVAEAVRRILLQAEPGG